MQLHDGQVKWLNRKSKKINILTPSNRWGKTVVTAVKHLHKNFYKVGIGQGNKEGWLGLEYRTANISPSSSNTEACFKAMCQIMESRFPIPQPDGSVINNKCLIGWFEIRERRLNTAPFKIVYANNASTEFRSMGADKGDSLQGKPYGYISYDEGGRSDHLETEIWDNILPRLADWNGELDIPSTPDSNSPSILYHYQIYNMGLVEDSVYYTQKGSIDDNQFLSQDVRNTQISLYQNTPSGPQVLHGEFVFGGDNIFPIAEILKAMDESLNEGEAYIPGHRYMLSIDTAIGSDERVYNMIDWTDPNNLRLARKKYAKGASMSPQMHMLECQELFDSYNKHNNVTIMLETFNGESARFYMDLPEYMKVVTKCYGTWQPPALDPKIAKKRRSVKKTDIIISLRKAISGFIIKFSARDAELKQQLSIYREDDSKLPTDHVISLALGIFEVTDGQPKLEEAQFVAW